MYIVYQVLRDEWEEVFNGTLGDCIAICLYNQSRFPADKWVVCNSYTGNIVDEFLGY